MTDPAPINQPLGGAGRADAATPAGRTQKTEGTGGAGFQAMLDKIEERARALAQQSRTVEKPEELAGAVDSARESLEDVLSLKDRLLEEYRQAQRQEPPAESAG